MMDSAPHRNRDLHDPRGWEARYESGEIPWDLGLAPPCLVDLLSRLAGAPLRVLVPGAGYGHDALAWARGGHAVTAIDIAPSAVEGMRARSQEAGLTMQALQEDLFDLPPSMQGVFDAVWEQTCFCAILPAQREGYVRAMANALCPGGVLYGLFWNHGMEQGPPFTIREEDVRTAFDEAFLVEGMMPVEHSAGGRQNEFLAVLRKRD